MKYFVEYFKQVNGKIMPALGSSGAIWLDGRLSINNLRKQARELKQPYHVAAQLYKTAGYSYYYPKTPIGERFAL